MHDRAELRVRHLAGESIRGIARSGPSRNAVRRALAPGARDRYHRRSTGEDFEEAVRDVLADYPHMAVVDVAVLIDWRRSRRTLSDLVARLRPEYASRSEVTARPLSTIRAGALAGVRRMSVGSVRL
jgi:DNA-binding NarL/FixJ family response regulator